MRYGNVIALAILGLFVLSTDPVSAGAPVHSPSSLVVLTGGGKVQGVLRNGVHEWRGIPYAKAPVGRLRWVAPQAATPWHGVREATHFGPACPQQARFNLTDGSLSEDCLTLNVSVPVGVRAGEVLPVFFYIHGGAFVGGSSNLYRLDALARLGHMVVVSANYRLGVLGFMPHPAFATEVGLNGNYGIEDQRLALAWVQRNIAAFGGDPSRVTVAGESAGAGSVCLHLAAPERTRGLFAKAAIISAGCLQPMKTVAEGEGTGRRIAAMLSCTQTDAAGALACMRAVPVDKILAAQGRYADESPTDLTPFGPVIGTAERANWTIPRAVQAAVETDRLLSVPVLMGGAHDELRLYVGYWWQSGHEDPAHRPTLDDATIDKVWLPLIYQGNASAVSVEYTPAGGWPAPTNVTVPEALGELMSDFTPGIGINNCLYLHVADVFSRYIGTSTQPSPLYEWEFSDPDAPVNGVGIAAPYPPFTLGPVHSAVLNYFFPKMSNTHRIDAPDLPMASEALAAQMVRYLARFAATGRPAVDGLPEWPRYSGGATVMNFVPGKVGVYDASAQHRCAFWRGLYPDRLAARP